LPERGSDMSEAQKRETLTRALGAALVRLGVGTALFEPEELVLTCISDGYYVM